MLRALICLLLCPSVVALRRSKLHQESSPTDDETSLLQRAKSEGLAKQTQNDPLSPGFFHDFDQDESTIDEAQYFKIGPKNELAGGIKGSGMAGVKKEFFEESPSAGSSDAWQTYPGLGNVPANRMAHQGTWVYTGDGYAEEYSGTLGFGGHQQRGMRDAEWFDSSTLNYNGLGEHQQPPHDEVEFLKDVLPGREWVQRAVNTTVTCKEVGCTALSQLNVFDIDTEEAKFCRLNIVVHPTDYDNDFSHEFIRYWKVNNHIATGSCQVHELMGCNASTWRPLVPCLQDLSVDHLLKDGKLVIEGQINELVDECPFEGNLLSAVAMVTCMARPKVNETIGGAMPQSSVSLDRTSSSGGRGNSSSSAGGATGLRATSNLSADGDLLPGSTHLYEARLQCGEPGCAARTLMNIDSQVLRAGATCFLNISVVQTDFDESVGNIEQIEFITVSGLGNVATNVTPGRNPCTEEYSTGKPVSFADRVYSVVQNQNISDAVRAYPVGRLVLDGKISHQVDDCASNNLYLLDALAMIECKIPATTPTI